MAKISTRKSGRFQNSYILYLFINVSIHTLQYMVKLQSQI